MNLSHFDQCRINPDNWKLGFLYVCKDDPRIIVPNRNKGFGWTLNFARPLAIPLMLLLLGIPTSRIRRRRCHRYCRHSPRCLSQPLRLPGPVVMDTQSNHTRC